MGNVRSFIIVIITIEQSSLFDGIISVVINEEIVNQSFASIN